jgi:tyrosyl-tRNA synthetase
MKEGRINPRDVKMKLAFEITKFFHGEDAAKEAQEGFIKVFSKRELPEEMPIVHLDTDGVELVELLVKLNVAESKSEAKRLIQQGGVRLDGEKVTDIHAKITLNTEKILKVGKRQFFKLVRKV